MSEHSTRNTVATWLVVLALGACPADPEPPTPDVATDATGDAATDGTGQPDVPTTDSTTPDAQPGDTTPDVGPVGFRGPCALDVRYGAFVVQSDELFGYVDGSVSDGVVPVTILEETATEGDCRLLKRNNPFCSPPCSPGTTCDFDGSCIPFPEPQDLGTVTVDGLVGGAVAMDPVQPGNTYFNTSVPNPPFEPGAAITLRTGAAGVYGEKVLRGEGHEVLSLGGVDQWDVTSGEALPITWTAPTASDSVTQVTLLLNIDQHGNSPLNVVCAFDDDGAGEVPAAMVTALFDAGVSGYPNGTLTRRTVDSVDVGAGCMEFIVASPRTPDVRVAGHNPCNTTADCPSGQTCNVAINTCE